MGGITAPDAGLDPRVRVFRSVEPPLARGRPVRLYCCHAGGAHPGRDRRGRAGGDAARAPARPRGRRVGRGREPVGGVRRLADPRRHPRAVHRRPAARGRARRAAGARGRRAPRHLPAVAGRAAPPRLRRPDRAIGLGLRADRGAEGPGRGGPRARAGRPLRGRATPRCTTWRPTSRRSPSPGTGRRCGCAPTSWSAATARSGRRGAPYRTRRPGSAPIPTPGSASSPTSPRRPTS